MPGVSRGAASNRAGHPGKGLWNRRLDAYGPLVAQPKCSRINYEQLTRLWPLHVAIQPSGLDRHFHFEWVVSPRAIHQPRRMIMPADSGFRKEKLYVITCLFN